MKGVFASALAVLLAVGAGGCGGGQDEAQTVTVYTALDRVHSEPILKDFERQTGIRVQCVYDTEAAKTTGLVNRLIARRDHPDCDVLWNNESVQTQRLAAEGLLAPYVSDQAGRFDSAYRDATGLWTGFAGRLRVIICNTDLIDPADVPARLADWTDPAWRGKAAIARPFYGTTLTHMAVLHDQWGAERLKAFLEALRANDVAVCDGNGHVRDVVAAGQRAFGLTDTDDALGAMKDGKPVAVLLPESHTGAILIPNTVALIAGAPHPRAGQRLIDYLLSPEVERRLAASRSGQIPLAGDLADVATPWDDLAGYERKTVAVIDEPGEAIGRLVDLLTAAGMTE
ncbi:MAG: extracellular solute-binding protein [Planctomycetes bacterium]|nr:extracellular solute-binding protein [Planctomycetota bacterium]